MFPQAQSVTEPRCLAPPPGTRRVWGAQGASKCCRQTVSSCSDVPLHGNWHCHGPHSTHSLHACSVGMALFSVSNSSLRRSRSASILRNCASDMAGKQGRGPVGHPQGFQPLGGNS